MENAGSFIAANKLLIGVLVVLCVLLVLSLIKKVVKMVFTLAVILVLVAAYLHFFGKRPLPENPLSREGKQQIEKLKSKGSETIKGIGK